MTRDGRADYLRQHPDYIYDVIADIEVTMQDLVEAQKEQLAAIEAKQESAAKRQWAVLSVMLTLLGGLIADILLRLYTPYFPDPGAGVAAWIIHISQ